MSPLNTDRDNDDARGNAEFEEDTRSEIFDSIENCMVYEEPILRQRHSKTIFKETVEEDKMTADLSQTCTCAPENNYANSEVESKLVKKRLNSETVEKCEQTKVKSSKLKVYKKQPKDNLLPNSSLKTALFEISPSWIKSFIQDPEHFMAEEKTKSEVHRQADSLFSTSSGFTNYRGMLNLCIILLVLSNARLFLENIIKYGILIEPLLLIKIFMNQPHSSAILSLVVGANVFILAIFYTEKALSKSLLSERIAFFMQSIILIMLLVIPAGVVLFIHPNPLISMNVLGMYTVAFLKLVSYASVNQWCRQARSPRTRMKRSKSVSVSEGKMEVNDEEIITYPGNLTYKDLYYFMLAPTLCYEMNFPRTLRIRKRFLLKRLLEMLFVIQLILGCIQQWILPLVNNSLKPLADMDAMRCMERLLKLAVPNHFIWLMFFYWFFHSTLNVLAELLKFGDREFYKDWWNSDTVNEFWQNWNIPVHRWALRHLYKPLVKRGYSKSTGSIMVFFVSAFFHEYLLSVPLRMFRLWAFMGMLGQVPLALVQVKYLHGKYGNFVVWLSLILGQPIAILAYFHDYYVMEIAPQLATNQTQA